MKVTNFVKKAKIFSKTWFDIGKLIYLISGGSNDGYELWLLYSQFDPVYKEDFCYKLWSGFDELMPENFTEEDYEYSQL